MKLTIDATPVSQCAVTQCAFNVSQSCNAKAITVGDEHAPGCDTFFDHSAHVPRQGQSAGVGACKMASCRHNQDLECTADSISVGIASGQAHCRTYSARQAGTRVAG